MRSGGHDTCGACTPIPYGWEQGAEAEGYSSCPGAPELGCGGWGPQNLSLRWSGRGGMGRSASQPAWGTVARSFLAAVVGGEASLLCPLVQSQNFLSLPPSSAATRPQASPREVETIQKENQARSFLGEPASQSPAHQQSRPPLTSQGWRSNGGMVHSLGSGQLGTLLRCHVFKCCPTVMGPAIL